MGIWTHWQLFGGARGHFDQFCADNNYILLQHQAHPGNGMGFFMEENMAATRLIPLHINKGKTAAAINNIPITRKGITATPLQMDFENTASFLVDAAIYNGSSGSPVFVFNQGSFYKPDGSVNIASRLKLVGIIHKVFNILLKEN